MTKHSFVKVLTHPDKKIIVKMLLSGNGVRAVARFLRERYPDQKKMHISVPTLQSFRKQKLNVEGEALAMIKENSKNKKIAKEEIAEEREIKRSENEIKKLPMYQEKIKEIVDYHVDIQKELKELFVLAKARMEDLFDKAAAGQITINEEANLQRYFQIITTNIERWAKYVEKIADRTVETNVNITVIEDQMSLMRDAVREIISEMSPELQLKFLDRLSQKMSSLTYRPKRIGFETIKTSTESDLVPMQLEDEMTMIIQETTGEENGS